MIFLKEIFYYFHVRKESKILNDAQTIVDKLIILQLNFLVILRNQKKKEIGRETPESLTFRPFLLIMSLIADSCSTPLVLTEECH